MSSVKLIFGTFPIAQASDEQKQQYLDILEQNGVKELDTANIYPDSEKVLGELQAPSKFTIDTKAPGFFSGALSKKSIEDGVQNSLTLLKTDHVETYFFHAPDDDTDYKESCDAIQELYKAGKIKRFGVSNFQPKQIQEIHDYCKSKDYVLPSVYQGNYNAVARKSEAEIFPLLRKLGISFYAYSPIAGGFLVKSRADIEKGGQGRWDPNDSIGAMYHKLYNRPSLLDALDEWAEIAKDANVSKAALAYRWAAHHSQLSAKHDDGLIIGATKTSQLEESLKAIKAGPLEQKTAERIQKVWEAVAGEAPFDNYAY